ncbi:Gfo/Idh/MocA family protein [Marisediminicola senii]|uniref:Gfo/Idh/MocA family protein n=1 Tax=Marisediminicola senii TaxID=2711233 RepID=UPI0013EAC614|nr:Gfo/Idh/MocA family oxidoreductase [Marisediminicola senii]
MAAFQTLASATEPVRMVLVGAGGMGKQWIAALTANADVDLVGVVDLDMDAARAALDAAGLDGTPVGTSVSALAAETGAHAVVNVTVPVAHHPVNVEAMFAGLPVLCEKPAAPTVSLALSLAASAEAAGQLLMISQSRRYYQSLAAFRSEVGGLGDIGMVTTEFFKAPRFGGFRDEMQHVLLVDMAIHAFDVARYLVEQDPVAVYCDEFNPSWSWYRADAAATAVFELSGGTRYVYTGSWCSDGLETSWNGSWRVSGAGGTATWDGEGQPTVERVSASSADDAPTATAVSESADAAAAGPEEIAGSLAEFVSALRTGETPSGEIHSNIYSLAMVEAAVTSAETHQRVLIDDVITAALADAKANERNDAVRAILEGWESPAAIGKR